MKINPKLIGFDIDGVVADTAGAFIRLADSEFGFKSIKVTDITNFEVEKCLPIPAKIIDSIFDILMRNPVEADLRPMPGAVDVLTKMARHAPVTFITARPEKKPIEDWLIKVLGSTYKNVRLYAMGDHDGKPYYVKKLGLQYFVDDRAQTCVDLQQSGLTPLVFSQPWNEGQHQLKSVNSWSSIKELLHLPRTTY